MYLHMKVLQKHYRCPVTIKVIKRMEQDLPYYWRREVLRQWMSRSNGQWFYTKTSYWLEKMRQGGKNRFCSWEKFQVLQDKLSAERKNEVEQGRMKDIKCMKQMSQMRISNGATAKIGSLYKAALVCVHDTLRIYALKRSWDLCNGNFVNLHPSLDWGPGK